MPLIRETILTTISAAGVVHMAPIGLIAAEEGRWIAAPFAPSTTSDNLRAVPQAVANHVGDVRVFAGCLTGRRNWPVLACSHVLPPRLVAAITHDEMVVERVEVDPQRPRYVCRIVRREQHAAFEGYNRAQAAVIEGAILVSRLSMLPPEKVARELDYLRIAIGKTAGEAERIAWSWLEEAVAAYAAGSAASSATAAAGAQAPSQPGSDTPTASA